MNWQDNDPVAAAFAGERRVDVLLRQLLSAHRDGNLHAAIGMLSERDLRDLAHELAWDRLDEKARLEAILAAPPKVRDTILAGRRAESQLRGGLPDE